jgi:hypothetical protein
MFKRLVLGGSTIREAETINASRKMAFNKANPEHKKTSMSQTLETGLNNTKKQRKTDTRSSLNNSKL